MVISAPVTLPITDHAGCATAAVECSEGTSLAVYLCQNFFEGQGSSVSGRGRFFRT